MTLPAVPLWRVLRDRPGGHKFRRQHRLEVYVIDFFCREAGLAIEIDREARGRGDRPEPDEHRDAALRSKGVAMLRISARAVLQDLDAVVRHIVASARDRTPLHHPVAPGGPPPREKPGGD